MFISSQWDVKEPTHYSRRVGNEVPGVVAVLCECMGGWVGIAGPHQLNSCQNFNLLKQTSTAFTARASSERQTSDLNLRFAINQLKETCLNLTHYLPV